MPRLSTRLAAAILGAGSLAACGDDAATAPRGERFTAQLLGTNVVPAVTTTASGSATFEVVNDTLIRYTLDVAGITGVTQANVHTGAAGANGAILLWLLPGNGTAAQTPSVDLTGTIAEGEIARSWIRGTPQISLDSLKALFRAGRAYVNVRTQLRTAGEIRGQIQPAP